MATADWKSFVISLIVLTLVHSIVSFFAYRCFEKRTIESSLNHPAVDVTSPGQQTKGEATIVLKHEQVTVSTVPTPVIHYMWFGYLGLAVAIVTAIWFRFFP